MEEESTIEIVNSVLQQNAVLKEKNKQLEDLLLSVGQARRLWSGTRSKMSHDIRTPMNAIVGFTSIALEEKGNPQRTKECLKQIEDATLYLLSLVNDFIEAPQEETVQDQFSLLQVLEEVEQSFQVRSKQEHISFELVKSELKNDNIVGNKLQVQQVLMGILNKASLQTEENGEIKLYAETLAENIERTIISFRVIDRGSGINEEYIERTFLPFEEESDAVQEDDGTGMSVVNSLVSLLNGVIKVESRVGNETIVKVELPFKLQEKKPVEPESVKKPPELESSDADSKVLIIPDIRPEDYQFSGQHILLAEDNELNSEIMEAYLKQSNLQVDTAPNGQLALEYFMNSKEGYYSIILMDIRMPVMDGRTTTRTIRGLPRSDASEIPIIAMSADAYSEEIKYSQSIGMNEYLTKPIYKEVLYQMLAKYINSIEKGKKYV